MSGVKPRLQEFEALRALSIVLLLALHSEIFGIQVFGYEVGHFAEFVGAFLLGSFFFLAGYFENSSLQKNKDNIFYFIRAKFIRIFPPYWLALLASIFIMEFSLKKRFDLSVYILNLQFIFSPAFVKQILTLWYLSIVVAYYFIFGILAVRTKSNAALLVWSAVVFGAAYILHLTTDLLDARFFQYYFIFLAGIYFSRYEEIREILFKLRFIYKIGIAALGAWLFWLVQAARYQVIDGLYLLAVDIFILGWVLMWLTIFRKPVGSWHIWSLISTASFFAYLYHRPLWKLMQSFFVLQSVQDEALFRFLPGSLVVLIVCYFLQRGYDRILVMMRLAK